MALFRFLPFIVFGASQQKTLFSQPSRNCTMITIGKQQFVREKKAVFQW
jgi:hypothetical protein